MKSINNFGELTEVITNKFDYENVENCTNQQAFYKLKNVLIQLNLGNQKIEPKTKIEELVPRKNRIQNIKEIEKKLGFKLPILRPKNILLYSILLLWISVIVLSFVYFFYALIFGVIFYFLTKIIFEQGKEFKVLTVGELSERMTLENYFKARKNPKTINKEEFKKVVLNWFSDRLDISKEELKTAKFV